MKETVNFSRFSDCFRDTPFSYSGLRALFDYLEELEEECETEREFCPIEIRGDYTEYEDIGEFLRENLDYKIEDIEDYNELSKYITIIPIDDERFIAANN